ncbi:MAG TPA: hypothetical protein VN442_03215 [Bryobacteraceae bacterium]|nr:hypothetical protein [Bryobacteraceae bacterium]
MRKYRRWLLAAGIAAAAGLLMVALQWQRARTLATPEALLKRLPARDAVIVYVDFAALRRTGLLDAAAASAVTAEPEYRDFVQKTRFDYTTDLDSAIMALAPSGRYFLVRGRFDWPRLRAYAAQAGGSCRNQFCTMPGSTPQRKISFVPLTGSVMALAVGADDMAAEVLTRPDPAARPAAIPPEPVWVSVPAPALKSGQQLPAGTRLFAQGIENAESVLVALGPEKQRFAITVDVHCRSDKDAAALAGTMQRATTALRATIEREHQTPNPRDLSGVLALGSFRNEGARVRGRWPVERVFFEELFRGAPPS